MRRVVVHQEDQSVWARRPTTNKVLNAAVKNTRHLLALRRQLLFRMMTDFIDGTNIYLGVVRDATDEVAEKVRLHVLLVVCACFCTLVSWYEAYSLMTSYYNAQYIPVSSGQA